MDMHQESKNTDDGLPVLASVVKQFFDEFAQQVNKENDDKLPALIESTKTTVTYLHNLNEYCLLKIFEVASLTLMDLCSLAETCTLFQRIMQSVFPKDLSIEISPYCYYVATRKYFDSTDRTSQDIKRIFKNCGSCLSEVSISITLSQYQVFLLNLVAEHCVDSLDSLRIEYIYIPAVIAVKMKPIFRRLRLLDLDGVSIEECDKTLFANLDSLIELEVRRVDMDSAILDNIFPKLKRFTYRGCVYRGDNSLLTFIARHRSLKILRLAIDEAYCEFKMNLLQVIGNSCMELEELDLYVGLALANASSLQPLEQLQLLKTLKLRRMSCDDLKFLPALAKLRELQLHGCYLPEDSNKLASLTQLTKLIICGGRINGSFDVIGIIRRLTNLQELTISVAYRGGGERFVLDEETFSKIVAVAKGRPTVLTLKCEFNFVSKSCDENRMVRLIRNTILRLD